MKNVEFELHEGRFEKVIVGKKPIKASYANALKRAQDTPYWETMHNGGYASNPFSGVQRLLTPFQLSLYTWLLNWYSRYERGLDPKVPVACYDNVKYLFLEVDADAYFELID